jgi:hypothetical protein
MVFYVRYAKQQIYCNKGTAFYVQSVPRCYTIIRTKQCHLVLGWYKYGNLALQVEGVSDETVKYGFGF